MWRRTALALALLLAAALCRLPRRRQRGSEVVASFYPLQYVAERIVGCAPRSSA